VLEQSAQLQSFARPATKVLDEEADPKDSQLSSIDKRPSPNVAPPAPETGSKAGPDLGASERTTRVDSKDVKNTAEDGLKHANDIAESYRMHVVKVTDKATEYKKAIEDNRNKMAVLGEQAKQLATAALSEIEDFEVDSDSGNQAGRAGLLSRATKSASRRLPGVALGMPFDADFEAKYMSDEEKEKIRKIREKPKGCETGPHEAIEKVCAGKAQFGNTLVQQAQERVQESELCTNAESKQKVKEDAAKWCLAETDDLPNSPFYHHQDCTLQCEDSAGSIEAERFLMARAKVQIGEDSCSKVLNDLVTSTCCQATGVCFKASCDTHMWAILESCKQTQVKVAVRDAIKQLAPTGQTAVSSLIDVSIGDHNQKPSLQVQAAEIRSHHQIEDPISSSRQKTFLGSGQAAQRQDMDALNQAEVTETN